MSHTNNTVIKAEETTTLQRLTKPKNANPTRTVKSRRVKGPAIVIKVDDASDNDTASSTAESKSSHASRKRSRDPSDDEEEDQKPFKRRLSEQEIVELQDEAEVMQSLMEDCSEGEEECEDPVGPLLEEVEPVPEVSLTLWSRHASATTERSRARAPSPPEEYSPATPPWTPEPGRIVVRDHSVHVGGRQLRLTSGRRDRLGLPPLEGPGMPTAVVVTRKKVPATKRKPLAKGRTTK